MEEEAKNNLNDDGSHSDLINAFSDITSSSKEEALFFLESHNFDLDSAIATFFETTTADPTAAPPTRRNPNRSPDSQSPSFSPSTSPSRSRSASPPPSLGLQQQTTGVSPYNLRSRNSTMDKKPSGSRSSGRIRTFSDLNRRDNDSGSDSDEPQEYYTGGEKSGMLVQDPSRANDVESLFNQARQAGAEEGTLDQLQPSSSSRSFTGRGRLLSGETVSASPHQPEPEVQTHTITFWTNGFTIDDGPLRRLDDPENASFLESIRKSECPHELRPPRGRAPVQVSLVRKLEEYPVRKQRQAPFRGVGRTLGNNVSEDATASAPAPAPSLNVAPTPSVGLVVDDELPSTSIQLRLSDGTRMVSRFNYHHTISNIRSFIDASRPGGPRSYQLQTMGFPPKQLNDLNETIEQAGIANSVVIQKL